MYTYLFIFQIYFYIHIHVYTYKIMCRMHILSGSQLTFWVLFTFLATSPGFMTSKKDPNGLVKHHQVGQFFLDLQTCTEK